GDWVEKTIGDIATVVGGSTPSTRDPANFDGDIPWLTPKDLAGPHPRYITRGERNLSRLGLERCSAQILPANSVLLSSRAPIGYLAIARNPLAT
ncbi:restriction endonuclease subunit S, partial [Salmonella enterica subsp. enterica]